MDLRFNAERTKDSTLNQFSSKPIPRLSGGECVIG
jgi:hypothetical protein